MGNCIESKSNKLKIINGAISRISQIKLDQYDFLVVLVFKPL